MLALFAPLEQLDEGVEEALQPGQDAAEETGIDFGVGQELVAAGSKAVSPSAAPCGDSVRSFSITLN
jgi:hypothetical protein